MCFCESVHNKPNKNAKKKIFEDYESTHQLIFTKTVSFQNSKNS